MKHVAILFGMMLLLYGCASPLDYFQFQQSGPVQQAQPPSQPSQPTCADGTAINSCSLDKPMFCTASSELVPNPSLCGCPAGTILSGGECRSGCDDGTPFSTCAAEKPFYCNAYGSIVEKASVCGCPTGKALSGETCIPVCTDGTLPGECSTTKPKFCTDSLVLSDDPARCGCPTGTVLKDGRCTAARCTDGTLVGSCSVNMLPTYCSESLTLVRNPRVCGCLPDEILSEDMSTCLNPEDLVYQEGAKFKIFNNAYMRIRDAEWIECSTGDYIRLQLQVDNSEGDTNYPIYSQELRLLEKTGPGYASRNWISVQYPSHDGLCVEPDRFAWTYTMEGDVNTGMVWYYLPDGFNEDADYYIYYREIMVELSP